MDYGLRELASSPAPELLITLEEAKQHLRVDVSDDDSLITGMIRSATRVAENYVSRAFVSRQFEMTLDRFPGTKRERTFPQEIVLPRAPLVSLDEVAYQSTEVSGSPEAPVEKTVEAVADKTRLKPRIVPLYEQTWPDTALVPEAVKITFTAGMGSADDVPEDIKAAVKLILGSLYEHREEQVVVTIATRMPFASREILSTYRLIGL